MIYHTKISKICPAVKTLSLQEPGRFSESQAPTVAGSPLCCRADVGDTLLVERPKAVAAAQYDRPTRLLDLMTVMSSGFIHKTAWP